MSEKSRTLAESPSSNVIPIGAARRLRETTPKSEEYAYQARILGMDKLSLLEEMIRFQQERSQRGELDGDMIFRGRHLFKALEEQSETEELRSLARSYRRHLESEYSRRIREGSQP